VLQQSFFYGEKPEAAFCGGDKVQSCGLPQSGGLRQFTARPWNCGRQPLRKHSLRASKARSGFFSRQVTVQKLSEWETSRKPLRKAPGSFTCIHYGMGKGCYGEKPENVYPFRSWLPLAVGD
jgi:hypothetical protein